MLSLMDSSPSRIPAAKAASPLPSVTSAFAGVAHSVQDSRAITAPPQISASGMPYRMSSTAKITASTVTTIARSTPSTVAPAPNTSGNPIGMASSTSTISSSGLIPRQRRFSFIGCVCGTAVSSR